MIGLPTLSSLDHAQLPRIWLAAEPADMRCGFDRLAELARSVTGQDPLCGHLFLFRGRRGDRLKVLYWDRDGYALWYKRLEEGPSSCPGSRPGNARWSCGPASWRCCSTASTSKASGGSSGTGAAGRKNNFGKGE